MVNAEWVKTNEEDPAAEGWYLTRYCGDERPFPMFFRTAKRHYSDSQWFVKADTGHSWQGQMHDEWLRLDA